MFSVMTRIRRMVAVLSPLALVLFPLALIFTGTAMHSLPLAFVVVGGLLWLDLNLSRKGKPK
jgi:hypothetical protein